MKPLTAIAAASDIFLLEYDPLKLRHGQSRNGCGART
jgi:hypothetical protein